MKRQIDPTVRLIRGAVLSGYVDVANLVGLDPKRLLVLRLRIGARYHPTLTSRIVDLDQSADSWTANMEETLEVGGSLAHVGIELLEHRTWAIFFARICERLRESCLSNDSGQSR